MDSIASVFYTMELQINKKNTFAPHLSPNDNFKHQVNAILPPFVIEGHDGVTWDEMLW